TLTLAIICLEKVGWATRCPSIESNVGQQVAQPTSYEQMQISNRTMLKNHRNSEPLSCRT
ncbi:hypothetical protein KJ966_06380, partial [bacterium]|nr:hypothetical protein [bacterium]